jgi:hypothetical protein
MPKTKPSKSSKPAKNSKAPPKAPKKKRAELSDEDLQQASGGLNFAKQAPTTSQKSIPTFNPFKSGKQGGSIDFNKG